MKNETLLIGRLFEVLTVSQWEEIGLEIMLKTIESAPDLKAYQNSDQSNVGWFFSKLVVQDPDVDFIPVLKALLNHQVDFLSKNNRGEDGLEVLLQNGLVNHVDLIFKHNPEFKKEWLTRVDQDNRPWFHRWVELGNLDALEKAWEWFDAEGRPDLQDNRVWLHVRHPEVLTWLIKKNIKPSKENQVDLYLHWGKVCDLGAQKKFKKICATHHWEETEDDLLTQSVLKSVLSLNKSELQSWFKKVKIKKSDRFEGLSALGLAAKRAFLSPIFRGKERTKSNNVLDFILSLNWTVDQCSEKDKPWIWACAYGLTLDKYAKKTEMEPLCQKMVENWIPQSSETWVCWWKEVKQGLSLKKVEYENCDYRINALRKNLDPLHLLMQCNTPEKIGVWVDISGLRWSHFNNTSGDWLYRIDEPWRSNGLLLKHDVCWDFAIKHYGRAQQPQLRIEALEMLQELWDNQCPITEEARSSFSYNPEIQSYMEQLEINQASQPVKRCSNPSIRRI